MNVHTAIPALGSVLQAELGRHIADIILRSVAGQLTTAYGLTGCYGI